MENDLAENIVLLHLLNPEPGRAGEDLIPDAIERDQQQNRVLSLQHEQAIAEDLVFLAAYTDDALKVIALCIEEKAGGDGMIIRTAINSGDQRVLQQGLQEIAAVLEEAARQDFQSAKDENALLQAIIFSNRSRLLGRLRSQHAPSSRKLQRNGVRRPQPIPRLIKCAQLLQNCAGLSVVEWEDFSNLMSELDAKFRHLESMSMEEARSAASNRTLGSILEAMNKVTSRYHLSRMLSKLPADLASWGPDAKEGLVHRLKKLGRYHQACRYLLQAARRFSVFRSITIEPFDAAFFTRTASGGSNLTGPDSRGGLVHRSIQMHSNRLDKAEVKQIQDRLDKSLKDLQNNLKRRSRSDRRVHAEIQLLFYYETQPDTFSRPRVICSSKSACYLCNLFIQVHGRFHSPRTHGTLYPQWALPTIIQLSIPSRRKNELQSIIRHFNGLIEERIRFCLKEAKCIRIHPDESFFSKISINFTPTVLSITGPSANVPAASLSASEWLASSEENGRATSSLGPLSITKAPALGQVSTQEAVVELPASLGPVPSSGTQTPHRKSASSFHERETASSRSQCLLEEPKTLSSLANSEGPSEDLNNSENTDSIILGHSTRHESENGQQNIRDAESIPWNGTIDPDSQNEEDNSSENQTLSATTPTLSMQSHGSQCTERTAREIVHDSLTSKKDTPRAEQQIPLMPSSSPSQAKSRSRAISPPPTSFPVSPIPSPTSITSASNSPLTPVPAPETIHLTPNIAIWHFFPSPPRPPSLSSIRLLTPHIHITLEHHQASHIASRSSLDLSLNKPLPLEAQYETYGIWIRAEWLASESSILRGYEVFDLDGEWMEKTVTEGTLVGGDGIMLRRKGNFVSLRGGLGRAGMASGRS